MKYFLLMVFAAVAVSAEESQVLKVFAAENVQYVGELYKELLKVHPANFVVCPLSVQTVFALANGGAKGNTAKQITSSLHLPEGEDKVKDTFQRLGRSLQTNDKYSLSSATKIYLANYFKIKDQYKETAVDVFNSEIQNIDFGKTEQAVAEINKWVEEKTHDKIKDLLKKDMLSGDTVAVLINAMYFQGKWVKQFGETIKLHFNVNEEKAVVTNMMTISDDFNYYNNREVGAEFLEMPYEGEEISMTFVLPHHLEGLSALEARIADVLIAPKYEKKRVNAVIPKFKIESTTGFVPVLRALGITDAFTNAADFSGIGENQDHLVISEVIQKAFIEVDEKGTTAAAATAALFDRIASDDVNFIADHPFIFYLRHRVNGVLFIGRFSIAEKVTPSFLLSDGDTI